jgi:glycosyltransferase involved in cell wall biosynthesis
LDSIVNQTLSDIEIICINDGSTDNSLSILQEYAEKDSRFKVISKENEGKGASPARNLGLEMASGEFLLFLDADDFFELDMLECLVNKSEECDADIVLCNGYEYDDRTKTKKNVFNILNPKYLPKKDVFCYKDCPKSIFQISDPFAWNKLYRHKFLKKHNLKFQNIKYIDDLYFNCMQMALAEKICTVNKKLIYYRTGIGTSQKDGLTNYPDSSYIPFIELKKSLLDFGIYNDVKQSFANRAVVLMRYFYDKVVSFKVFKYLHDKYKNEIFKQLDICKQPKEFFHDENSYLWYCLITENTAEETLFQALRQYGGEYNTASLRFKFPCELIERGSKIILCGKNIVGRYYYAQILLSCHCEVVQWLNFSEPINNAIYDKILVVCTGRESTSKTEIKEQLLKSGIPENKIILYYP